MSHLTSLKYFYRKKREQDVHVLSIDATTTFYSIVSKYSRMQQIKQTKLFTIYIVSCCVVVHFDK